MLKNLGYPFRRIISLKKLKKVANHYGYTVYNDPMEYVVSRSDNKNNNPANYIVGSISKYDFNQWGCYGLNLKYPQPLISALILFKHTPLWLRFDHKNRTNNTVSA